MNVLFDLIGNPEQKDIRPYLELGSCPYPYYMVAFKAMYMRVLDSLKVFGFSCRPISSFFVELAQAGLSEALQLRNDAEPGTFPLNYLLQGTKNNNRTSRPQSLSNYISMKYGRAGLRYEPSLTGWSNAAQEDLSQTIKHAVHIAAHLSFTNWSTSLKNLTVEHFYRKRALTFNKIPVGGFSLAPKITVKELLYHLIPLCSNTFSAQHFMETYAGVEWAGIDIDGIIVLRTAALHDSMIDVTRQSLTLCSGRMVHESTRINLIKINLDGVSEPNESFFSGKDTLTRKSNDRSFQKWQLLNQGLIQTVQSHDTHQTITRGKDVLVLQHGHLYPGAIRVSTNPGGFSLLVPHVYVARSCYHNAETPLRLQSPCYMSCIDISRSGECHASKSSRYIYWDSGELIPALFQNLR